MLRVLLLLQPIAINQYNQSISSADNSNQSNNQSPAPTSPSPGPPPLAYSNQSINHQLRHFHLQLLLSPSAYSNQSSNQSSNQVNQSINQSPPPARHLPLQVLLLLQPSSQYCNQSINLHLQLRHLPHQVLQPSYVAIIAINQSMKK